MGNWRLMIVDDDRLTLAVLTAALKDWGTIDVAVSGDEALRRLETGPLPDLILLDMWMPGLNGFEVCIALKANPRLASIPVIFVTGATDHQTETRAFEAGAVDFISKPLNLPAVQARVGTQLTLLGQKRALEERVAFQSSRIEKLLNSIPDPVWFKDAEGVFVTVNPAVLRVLERSEDEVLNHTVREFFPPEIAARSEADDKEVLKTGKPGTYELETRSPSTGQRYFWEITKAPIASGENSQQGVLSIARDVTLRKETENRLRMLSLAVEQSPNAIIITDGDTRIEYVNAAFCRITGYSAATAIGQRAGFLASGKTPSATYAEMWKALNEGNTWRGRFINRTRDGREFIDVANVTAILDAEGKVIHYLSIQENITERIELAEEASHARAAAEVAEAANEAKSSFLAKMSHEIRTPMNAIIGLTHLMRQEQQPPLQAERLENISVAAEHLLGIINDILDISKIEAGRMELSSIDFRLADVIGNVSTQVAERIRTKGLLFTSDVAGLPLMLHGDAMRLTQILLNYIGNAVKFTARGSIKLAACVLEETDDTILVRFTVEDTGIGIAPEHLPRMFQAFEQADKSTTRKYGGSGLGLRINRHLAQLMGGEAGVESTPGVGSRFWATMRFGHAKTNLEASSSRTPQLNELIATLSANTRGLRVLLAEDNPINQEVALSMLSQAGIAADLAADGAEAVAAAKTNTYDLILMDMQMPELDGLAATQAIRRLPGYAATPIVAMTANAFAADRRACLAAGMNDHVAKPVNPTTLYSILLKWLARSQPVPPKNMPAPDIAPQESAASTLSRVAGLDYSVGLQQMSGKVAVYEKLLRQFSANAEKEMADLRQCLADDQRDKARKLAHSLKGSSGVMGATGIHKLAAALEGSLREQADSALIASQFDALAVESRRLIDGIANAPE